MMLPRSFPDRRAAFAGAFCARFALGFFRRYRAPVVAPNRVRRRRGATDERADAIITKAYAPILVTGIVFGAAAGWIVAGSAHPGLGRSAAVERRARVDAVLVGHVVCADATPVLRNRCK